MIQIIHILIMHFHLMKQQPNCDFTQMVLTHRKLMRFIFFNPYDASEMR